MRLSISHETTYHYEDQVRASIQYLRLTPHDSERQHVLSWQLDLPRPVRAQLDPFGNILHVLTMDEPHEAIIIGARGQVDIDELREAEHESQSALPFLRFTRLTEADAALRAFAEKECKQRRDRTALIDLMHGLNQHMTYTPGATEVDTSAAQAFAGRSGVCQDHTHAFIACARSLGIPARYVSGYLHVGDEAGWRGNLATHAWVEVFLPGHAWLALDPTNDRVADEHHIKVAVGRDYADAAPVRGNFKGRARQEMAVELEIVRVEGPDSVP